MSEIVRSTEYVLEYEENGELIVEQIDRETTGAAYARVMGIVVRTGRPVMFRIVTTCTADGQGWTRAGGWIVSTAAGEDGMIEIPAVEFQV
jgi:hypothetical protein